jgi:hypothetical protein
MPNNQPQSASLASFVAKYGSPITAAAKIGVSRVTLWRWLKGTRPRGLSAKRLEDMGLTVGPPNKGIDKAEDRKP